MARTDAILGNGGIEFTNIPYLQTEKELSIADATHSIDCSLCGIRYLWNNIERNTKKIIHSSTIAVEHSLSVGSTFHFIITRFDDKDPVTEVIKRKVPYLFESSDNIPVWEAIFIDLISITATVMWNYVDVFIMSISLGLSTQFKLFNAELKEAQGV